MKLTGDIFVLSRTDGNAQFGAGASGNSAVHTNVLACDTTLST
ncbi:MAG: hypothetical protein ACLPRE_08880 [Limisphaerales bacterium]